MASVPLSPYFQARASNPLLDPDLLALVEKPSRYIGGEVGQVRKDPSSVESRVALCYPDLYEIGMSHIGLKILYSLLNADPRVACERVYAVAPDMEAQLRARGLRLSTLENSIPLRDLDVLGFTLQYELSYTNLLQVLDLGGIPLRAAHRGRDVPLVIAGGPCAFNPEPLAPFLDAICLGDGEETIQRVVEVQRRWRQSGKPREDLLWLLTEVPGIYVPSLYTVHYHDDGRVAAVEPAHGLPPRVRKATVTDLDAAHYHTKTPVPFVGVVHDRVGIEIQRGCMRGCRFCQAGYIYRPERQRSPETIRRIARESLRATGQEEFSLLSLSAGDYQCMEPLLKSLMDEHEKGRSAISLPSMRLETLTPGIMEQIDRVRKTSFTVAPEAASDRLRGVINKVIDEEVLTDMVGEVFSRGWSAMKFYFMLGLPTEQEEDLQAMIDLGARCLSRARRHKRDANITISVSTFVPKSHTPFQWARQITLDQIRGRQHFLRDGLQRAKLGFRYHHDRSSVMEGIYSRGDRRSADALEAAYRLGARLDGWQEHLREDAWAQAFEEQGLDPAFYNQRRRDPTEVFPWQAIDIGMKPEWLWEDWMDALEAGFVPDCSQEPCYDCGVCDHQEIHNRVYEDDGPGAEPSHRARKPWTGSRKREDPQFVAMPRPPRKKGNQVTDAAPAQGLAPGSAGARAARMAQAPGPAAGGVARIDRRQVQHPKDEAGRPDWRDVTDTRLPPEWRQRVVLHYGKVGALVHLGHLEVMDAIRRAFKRVAAPVIWSQGFHPQMRISFGPPLPTGVMSTAEFCEVELRRPVELDVLERDLRAAFPDDMPLYGLTEVPWSAAVLPNRMGAFTWEILVPEPERQAARDRIDSIQRGDLPALVRQKKDGDQWVDVRSVILGCLELEPGRFAVTCPADGPGARFREVVAALVSDSAAAGRDGFRLSRTHVRFQDEPAGEERTDPPVELPSFHA